MRDPYRCHFDRSAGEVEKSPFNPSLLPLRVVQFIIPLSACHSVYINQYLIAVCFCGYFYRNNNHMIVYSIIDYQHQRIVFPFAERQG